MALLLAEISLAGILHKSEYHCSSETPEERGSPAISLGFIREKQVRCAALHNEGQSRKEKRMQLGFVGLGRMGAFMAKRLLRQGHTVIGMARHDRTVQGALQDGDITAGT